MAKKVSGTIAANGAVSGGKREKTRLTGVYQREIANKRIGKPDVAFDICYRDAGGKLHWELIGYKSDGVNAAFASQRRGEILAGISRGEKPKTSASKSKCMTFGNAWALFEDRCLPSLKNPNAEKGIYRIYLQDKFADRRLDTISTLELEQYRNDLLGKGYAPATVVLALAGIRRIFRKVIAWDLYQGKCPTDALKFPKVDNVRTRYLTQAETTTLLATLKKRSQLVHDIACISLYTGMRKGEILKLRGEHLDFASSRILVKDAKAGSRTVHMTPEVEAILEAYCPSNAAAFLFHLIGRPHESWSGTTPLTAFTKAVEDCKLNDGITDRRHKVVFHTLRHTFCSWLAISGVPLYTIAKLVGHKTIEMTQRYSHLCPNAEFEAASRIGELLRNGAADDKMAMVGQ